MPKRVVRAALSIQRSLAELSRSASPLRQRVSMARRSIPSAKRLDKVQKALVLRSPNGADTSSKKYPGVTFRVFARRSSVASVGFRRPLSKWLRWSGSCQIVSQRQFALTRLRGANVARFSPNATRHCFC
jgi:hypothetical protein